MSYLLSIDELILPSKNNLRIDLKECTAARVCFLNHIREIRRDIYQNSLLYLQATVIACLQLTYKIHRVYFIRVHQTVARNEE